MDQTAELLEALEARAREESLEELERRGKSRVKVIRPSEIAGMIQEAVEKAVSRSGYVPPEEVDRLVQEGRKEFQDLLAQREEELKRRNEEASRLQEAQDRASRLEKEVEELRAGLQEAEKRNKELEEKIRELESRPSPAPAEASAAGGGFNAELMMKLMGEIADLKAKVASPGPARSGEEGGEAKIASMLEQVMNSLEGKIEKIGKKVGIHEAVEGEEVKLDGLFTDHGDEEMENNLDTVQVKERSGAGIAANLERMKKLRRQGG